MVVLSLFRVREEVGGGLFINQRWTLNISVAKEEDTNPKINSIILSHIQVSG